MRRALALALVVPACGGDDREDDPNTGSGSAATADDDDGTSTSPGDDDGADGDGDGDGDTGGADDGDSGGDGTTSGADDEGSTGGTPGECPPSGKPAPTGCWSMPPGDWEDVRCGCGPSLGEVGGPTDSPEDISQCSHYGEVGQLFDEINSIRDQYVDSGYTLCHSRFKGIPWEGDNAGMTWSSYFSWDDCLAAQAHELAAQIAAGTASHGGTQVAGQNGGQEAFWMDNMFEDDFRITFDENQGDYDAGRFSLSQSNGSARMGLYYQDFDGDGPVIQQLGIGAAMGAGCRVTWVLQFGP